MEESRVKLMESLENCLENSREENVQERVVRYGPML